MQKDPEYRRLMHKHVPHHEAGGMEIIIDDQVGERQHNVEEAIVAIERKINGNPSGMGTTVHPHNV